MHSNRVLLILSCSARKRVDPDLLPAIERYDGVSYRLLRKAIREDHWPQNLDFLIVSAKYGLIEACSPTANYDQRMTCARMNQLKPQIMSALQRRAEHEHYVEIYVDLGQDYALVLEGIEELFRDSVVTWSRGRIGERLRQLKEWIIRKNGEDADLQQEIACDSEGSK